MLRFCVDIILDLRFFSWYKRREQAGFRPGQGCLLQIFLLLLLIGHSKKTKKNFLVGFPDYAKAFDFANRAGIVSNLMRSGCGKQFVKAITAMFATSTYYPKTNSNRLCDGIESHYGVTQGRKSSGNIFSYYVSDMPTIFHTSSTDDYMDPLCLAQLADDTALFAEKFHNLRTKFLQLLKFSDEKYQVTNVTKTLYCNFSESPTHESLQLNEYSSIDSVDPAKGYKYLGMMFYPTNDIKEIILRNFNKRMVNVSKFYDWLSINENTPMDVKLMVLDSCVFAALLYGVECWGNLDHIPSKLLNIEMKALKSIMKVKKSTTNDLVYHELNRCSIISKIKDRQYSFFDKVSKLSKDDALLASYIDTCNNTTIITYYKYLTNNNSKHEMEEREKGIRE